MEAVAGNAARLGPLHSVSFPCRVGSRTGVFCRLPWTCASRDAAYRWAASRYFSGSLNRHIDHFPVVVHAQIITAHRFLDGTGCAFGAVFRGFEDLDQVLPIGPEPPLGRMLVGRCGPEETVPDIGERCQRREGLAVVHRDPFAGRDKEPPTVPGEKGRRVPMLLPVKDADHLPRRQVPDARAIITGDRYRGAGRRVQR